MNVSIKLVFCLNSEMGSSFQATDNMPAICVAVTICTRGPGKDGRIILRWTPQEVGCWGMDWFKLAHDRDRWRHL